MVLVTKLLYEQKTAIQHPKPAIKDCRITVEI
jgi:hypothetical protein